jgi:homocysteine S-methyltransferase
MPDRLDELLAREPFAILDGGLATELERDGCVLDDPLWSAKILLEAPERVLAVHRRFARAGADILTTASYQATLPGLRARGLDEMRARALLRETVALARSASGPGTLVAASIGSYGAYLADGSEYRGDYGVDRRSLVEFHRPRFDELVAAGPDLLAFETIPSAVEAEAIAELLDANPGPRAWVSFSLRADNREGVQISDGTPLAQAIAPLRGHPRIAALGCNCVGPAEVLPALELLARETNGLPLIAYPNSGEHWHARAWAGSRTPPDELAALARLWLAAGARVIGGCCRTRPEHIAALARLRTEARDARARLT